MRFPGLRPAAAAVSVLGGVIALTAATTACGSSGTPGSAPSSVTLTRMGARTGQAPVRTSGASPSGAAAAPSPAGAGTLTGASASALATRAFTDTRAAASVRVNGSSVNAGRGSQSVTFGLTLVRNGGCEGTIALSKTQTFQIVETGGYVWMLPTPAFYASLRLSKADQARVDGKYIRVKSGNKQLADLTRICSFSGLFGSLPTAAGTGFVATPSRYHGGPSYKLTKAGSPGVAYLSTTAKPLVLMISDPVSGGGAITFSDYNAVVAITPPAAAATIDGSELGLERVSRR